MLPIILLEILIWRYSVDVPFWDQWDYVDFFVKLDRGTLSFIDLFAQQYEHRQFFPNILFVLLGWLTHWRVRYEMLASFLLACLISFNIYRLSKRTISSCVTRLMLLCAANLLIFSPVQCFNWLHGVQVLYFVPVACVTTCLSVAHSGFSAKTKFLLCASLSIISSFSAANGLLCWVVSFPVLSLSTSQSDDTKKNWLLIGWGVGFALSLAAYFYSYQNISELTHLNVSEHPSTVAVLVRPVQAIIYFVALLGAPLGACRGIVSAPIGAALLLMFAASCFYVAKFRSDFAFVERVMGWLMLGAYSLTTASLITIGRSGSGVEHAMSARYTSFTIYLAVSLIYLLPIIVNHAAQRNRSTRYELLLSCASFLLVSIFVASQALTIHFSIQWMSALRTELLRAKACLMFVNVRFEGGCLGGYMLADVDALKQRANALNSLGYLRPKLIASERIQEIEDVGKSNIAAYGTFENLETANDNQYVASGWAVLPDRKESADAIVLTYEKTGGDPIVFALIDTRTERNDVAQAQSSDHSDLGWRKSFYANALPAEATEVKAWAYDVIAGKAFQLAGLGRVERRD